MRRVLTALLMMSGTACGGSAQRQPATPKPRPSPALLLAPLTGQPIPVLPLTYVVADTGLGLPTDRVARLTWADSVLADALQAHGPEATWVFPPELRRVARRAPGIVKNPDQMSQAEMRFENLRTVPDPLLGNIRQLAALTGSRFVMIPAVLRFTRVAGGVQVESVLVIGDARSGAIAWRSFPTAVAPDAAAAINAIIAKVLPDAR
jgi:hypothetical protein